MVKLATSSAAFLRQRQVPLVAVFVTVGILLGLTFAPGYSFEEPTINQHYRLTLVQGQLLYALLSVSALVVFLFAPSLRRYLSNNRYSWIPLIITGIVSFSVVRLIVPAVGFHLAFYPLRIWWIITGIVALNCLIVLEVSQALSGPVQRKISQYVQPIIWLMFGVLLALYIVSIGSYNTIENIDEPWTAAIATNYAQNGSLESTFGGPQGDVLSPRYYVPMGLWLRLLSRTDLIALRSFPTLVAVFIVLLVAVALWRIPTLSNLQRAIGLVAMLASIPFLWSAHNLRPDIGLGIYSALVLLVAYPYFSNPGASKWWLVGMGAGLYIGLETIPTYATSWAFCIGLIVTAHVLRRPLTPSAWRSIGAYALGCIIAAVCYGLVHFWPLSRLTDLAESTDIYTSANQGRLFSPNWLLSGLSLTNTISPIENGFIIGSLALLFWRGDRTDRWIVAIFCAGIITAIVPWSATVGYLALITPFIAYTLARLCNTKTAVLITTFALLPALISMPVYDMSEQITGNRNLEFLNRAAAFTEGIEEGVTIVGDHRFWYILNRNRSFIGWPGVGIVAQINQIEFIDAVKRFKPDYLICEGTMWFCPIIVNSKAFTPIREMTIEGLPYILLKSR